MSITPEERRQIHQRRGDRRRACLRVVPAEQVDRTIAPGFRLTWPMVVGGAIAAVILMLGAVALGNGGGVDLGPAGSWMRLMLPRAE